nr:transcription termination/antitermination protein NusA [Aeromicrobium sp.]
MDIDMAALRALEREKEIPFEAICEAIETALLSAYHKTGSSHPHSRVELNRSTGHVTVWAKERIEAPPAPAPEEGEEPAPRPAASFTPEFDDTPEDFGRFAATIARQLIMQRIRDAEDESKYGEFAGKVGDIVS